MKKHLKKIVIGLLVVVVLLFLAVLLSFVRPISAKVEQVECVTWDATYMGISTTAEKIEAEDYDKDKIFIHSYDGLKSDNVNDYMNIYCEIKVTNHNRFEDFDVDAVVCEVGNYEDHVLFSYAASENIKRTIHPMSEDTVTVKLDVYVAGMSEQEIQTLVDGIKIKFIGKGFLGDYVKIFNLSDCSNVTIENSVSE